MTRFETIPTPADIQYDTYPASRLVLAPGAQLPPDNMLPEGPWYTGDVSDAPHDVALPTPEEVAKFAQQGLRVDTIGRPLHPDIETLLADRAVGVVTGNGFFWKYGPNITRDLFPIAGKKRPHIALIERRDGGGIAGAGGFADPGEPEQVTAIRENGEEMGALIKLAIRLALRKNPNALQKIYDGPVTADRRTTAHAWTHTQAFVVRLPYRVPLIAGDDALTAKWYPLDDLPDGIAKGHVPLIEKIKQAL